MKTSENKLPVGIRNNNPLNIVYDKNNKWHGQLKGVKGRFTAFTSMMWGFRAAAIILKKYIKVHKRDTIKKIISAWAPSSENDTKAYINFVSRVAGYDPDEKIDFNDMIKMLRIMSAMCQMENGRQYNPQSDNELWKALYDGYVSARG